MVTNIWGVNNQLPSTVLPSQTNAPLPAIADHGGGEVGIAYVTTSGQVRVDFLDEQGQATAPRPSTVVSSAVDGINEIAISASGILGYGVGWSEGTPDGSGNIAQSKTSFSGVSQTQASHCNVLDFCCRQIDRSSGTSQLLKVWLAVTILQHVHPDLDTQLTVGPSEFDHRCKASCVGIIQIAPQITCQNNRTIVILKKRQQMAYSDVDVMVAPLFD